MRVRGHRKDENKGEDWSGVLLRTRVSFLVEVGVVVVENKKQGKSRNKGLEFYSEGYRNVRNESKVS